MLFDSIWYALSPYVFDLLKLALAFTLFTNALRIIRRKHGHMSGEGGNPYSGITTAFIGYLFGRGIPIIIGMTDRICNDILSKLK